MVYQGQVWRLLTHAFCHDRYGVFHILFNMLFLYWFGCTLESMYGSREFLLFYLAAAVFAGLAFVGLDLYTGSRIPGIGASGAVMAVTMLYAMHFPRDTDFCFLAHPRGNALADYLLRDLGSASGLAGPCRGSHVHRHRQCSPSRRPGVRFSLCPIPVAAGAAARVVSGGELETARVATAASGIGAARSYQVKPEPDPELESSGPTAAKNLRLGPVQSHRRGNGLPPRDEYTHEKAPQWSRLRRCARSRRTGSLACPFAGTAAFQATGQARLPVLRAQLTSRTASEAWFATVLVPQLRGGPCGPPFRPGPSSSARRCLCGQVAFAEARQDVRQIALRAA